MSAIREMSTEIMVLTAKTVYSLVNTAAPAPLVVELVTVTRCVHYIRMTRAVRRPKTQTAVPKSHLSM
jgi:hypothetical protein